MTISAVSSGRSRSPRGTDAAHHGAARQRLQPVGTQDPHGRGLQPRVPGSQARGGDPGFFWIGGCQRSLSGARTTRSAASSSTRVGSILRLLSSSRSRSCGTPSTTSPTGTCRTAASKTTMAPGRSETGRWVSCTSAAFDLADTTTLSRHQDRISFTKRPELGPLLADYRDRILARGHHELRALSYAFNRFEPGGRDPADRTPNSPPGRSVRSALARSVFDHRPDSFQSWLITPVDLPRGHLNRLLLSLWENRPTSCASSGRSAPPISTTTCAGSPSRGAPGEDPTLLPRGYRRRNNARPEWTESTGENACRGRGLGPGGQGPRLHRPHEPRADGCVVERARFRGDELTPTDHPPGNAGLRDASRHST